MEMIIVRSFDLLIVAALCFGLNGLSEAQNSDPDTLPMFGAPAMERAENMRQAHELFIKDAAAQFGNRIAASDFVVMQGWEALRAGSLPIALRRFNEGWLLSPSNPAVFWGFGAVLSQQGKLPEAIEQLETARDLMLGETPQRVQLLCDIGAVRSAYAASLPRERELERAHQFSAANQRFAESLEIDPEYSPGWREWAISLYDQERFREASIKAARALELKASSFPADFLRKLNSKIAEPN
jgi:tetratricopeptide (TPR) repeat protein